jgi:hypothetical protein
MLREGRNFVETFPTLNDFVQTGVHKNYSFSLLDIDPAFRGTH